MLPLTSQIENPSAQQKASTKHKNVDIPELDASLVLNLETFWEIGTNEESIPQKTKDLALSSLIEILESSKIENKKVAESLNTKNSR